MAGYTPRFFLTLSIPFFGFVLWFLKRKSPSKSVVSKALQVEDSTNSELFEKQPFNLNPMKLKNQEDSCEESVNSAMQLKETQTSQSQNANGVQHNGTSKGKKKSKSKLREKSRTCQTDYITNGNGRLHETDNVTEIANGVEAIDLNTNVSAKDEFLNVTNKTHSEMEITNGTNSSNSASCVRTNGDANITSETDNLSTQQNGGAKECDSTDVVSISERNSDSNEKKNESTKTDSHELLMLPVDCAETQGEMLESPSATYCDSVGSTDSGRGGSEIHFESFPLNVTSYAFEIPQKLVGRLIGKAGKTVRAIKDTTNADILIKDHPSCDHNKICLLTGTENEINHALKEIRKKFPPEYFPSVTLSQICFLPFMLCPENVMLRLPEGCPFDVILSAEITAGHFFVQQPTHPTFHSLVGLTYQMTDVYNQDQSAPSLPNMARGYICAAHSENCWYRAEIEEVFPDVDECRVRFLDYGGYRILSRSALRQINYQFMIVPFQATECYLGLVAPPEGETEWSAEANAAFSELARGQVLQGFIIAYAENGVPVVQLYRITGANMIDISSELIRRGLARSLEVQPPQQPL